MVLHSQENIFSREPLIESLVQGVQRIREFLPPNIKDLRNSQNQLFFRLVEDFKNMKRGDERIIQKDTGTGKTLIFAMLTKIASQKGQVAIVVPTINLAQQTIGKLKEYYPEMEIDYVYSKTEHSQLAKRGVRKSSRIIVIVEDSLKRLETISYLDHAHFNPDLIILDESHLLQSDLFRKRLDKYKAYILSFSATPYRTRINKLNDDDIAVLNGDTVNWLPLHLAPYGTLIHQDNPKQLLADKEILPVTWHIIKDAKLRFDGVDINSDTGDYAEESLNTKLEANWVDIIDSYISDYSSDEIFMGRKNFFIACPNNTELARKGAEMFHRKTNEEVAIVTAKVSGIFKSGEFHPMSQEAIKSYSWYGKKHIFQIRQLREGYDDPSIDCVVMLNFTQIVSDYIQTIGRGRRVHDHLESLLVIDVVPINSSIMNPVNAAIALGTFEAISSQSNMNVISNLETNNNENPTLKYEYNMESLYASFEYPSATLNRLKNTELRQFKHIITLADVLEEITIILQQKQAEGVPLNMLIKTPSMYPNTFDEIANLSTAKMQLIKFNPSITYIELTKKLLERFSSILMPAKLEKTVAEKVEQVMKIHNQLFINLNVSKQQANQILTDLFTKTDTAFDKCLDASNHFLEHFLNAKLHPQSTVAKSSIHQIPKKSKVQKPRNTPLNLQLKDEEYINSMLKEALSIDKFRQVWERIQLNLSNTEKEQVFLNWVIEIMRYYKKIYTNLTLDHINEFVLIDLHDSKYLEYDIASKIKNIGSEKLQTTLSIENSLYITSSSLVFKSFFTPEVMDIIRNNLHESIEYLPRLGLEIQITNAMLIEQIKSYLKKNPIGEITQLYDTLVLKNPINENQIKKLNSQIIKSTIQNQLPKTIAKHLRENTEFIPNTPLLQFIKTYLPHQKGLRIPQVAAVLPEIQEVLQNNLISTLDGISILKTIYFDNLILKKQGTRKLELTYDQIIHAIKVYIEDYTSSDSKSKLLIIDGAFINNETHQRIHKSLQIFSPEKITRLYDYLISIFSKTASHNRSEQHLESMIDKVVYIGYLDIYISKLSENASFRDACFMYNSFAETIPVEDLVNLANRTTINKQTIAIFKTIYNKRKTIFQHLSKPFQAVISTHVAEEKNNLIVQIQNELHKNSLHEYIEPLTHEQLTIISINTKNAAVSDQVQNEYDSLRENKFESSKMIKNRLEKAGYLDVNLEMLEHTINFVMASKGVNAKTKIQQSQFFGNVYSFDIIGECLRLYKLHVCKSNTNFVTKDFLNLVYGVSKSNMNEKNILRQGVKEYYNISSVNNETLPLKKIESTISRLSKDQAVIMLVTKLKMNKATVIKILHEMFPNQSTYSKEQIQQIIHLVLRNP